LISNKNYAEAQRVFRGREKKWTVLPSTLHFWERDYTQKEKTDSLEIGQNGQSSVEEGGDEQSDAGFFMDAETDLNPAQARGQLK
jgi:hypothetical protein